MRRPDWTVSVVDRGRVTFALRARNRITRKRFEKSSTSKTRRAAEREAALWAAELNNSGLSDSARFEVVSERFLDQYASYRRPSTCSKFRSVFLAFDKHIGNPPMYSINESVVSEFCRRYGRGKSPATIASALRHLKVFLRWCHRNRVITTMPNIEMPRRPSRAGGRPLTQAEFDQMLEAVPKVRPSDADDWRLFLRGLWCSGLRVSEALALSWDERDPVAVVGIDTDRPAIRIEGSSQKGGRQTVTPCVPELVELLRSIPFDRSGKVFDMVVRQRERASSVVGAIGRAAGLSATAHDLRRSFATRWASRLPAQALRQLMRHASITTTLEFYATGDCGLADLVYKSGDKSGDKATDRDDSVDVSISRSGT